MSGRLQRSTEYWTPARADREETVRMSAFGRDIFQASQGAAVLHGSNLSASLSAALIDSNIESKRQRGIRH